MANAPWTTKRARTAGFATLLASLLLLSGCPMKDNVNNESPLPRFTKLEAFNPHRPTFECKHEASVNPPITQEAEALFQQAQAATSYELWPEQRNQAKAATLYEQAMKLGHWKAQFNLAGLYLQGKGVPQDVEKAIQLTEDLMKKGVPAAWDNMGAYYMGGVGGLKQDATVAYAFWQKAADMGSMAAQAYLGKKLDASHDEPPSFWGNRPVGLKMLECAFAQGSPQGTYELGLTLNQIDNNYDRALKVFHEGVKLGSEKSAKFLFLSFDDGDALVTNIKDRARAERYRALGNALYRNPDLRFPNLDKVLPLPPARLPFWDGKDESLINAAKAVVSTPPVPPKPVPHPASQRTGRAHIPAGFTLPEHPQVDTPAQPETTRAPESGYWIARLLHHSQERHLAWDEAQVPLRYAQGELFDRTRPGLRDEDGRIQFHYLGEHVPIPPQPDLPEHPLVARGLARYGDLPEPTVQCRGSAPCPHTGVWSARVPDDHPLALVFNQWHRQTYVEQGQPFPDPKTQHLDIEPRAVTWQWRAQANHRMDEVWTKLTLDEPTRAGAGTEALAEDAVAAAPAITAAPQAPTPPPERPPAKGIAGLIDRIWPPRG